MHAYTNNLIIIQIPGSVAQMAGIFQMDILKEMKGMKNVWAENSRGLKLLGLKDLGGQSVPLKIRDLINP